MFDNIKYDNNNNNMNSYDLPHEYLLSMVSAVQSHVSMEAWDKIHFDSNKPDDIYILHYCQGYWLGYVLCFFCVFCFCFVFFYWYFFFWFVLC